MLILLTAWEQFDNALTEFDEAMQRLSELVRKFEAVFVDDLLSLHETGKLLVMAYRILDRSEDGLHHRSGICSQASVVITVFIRLSQRFEDFKSASNSIDSSDLVKEFQAKEHQLLEIKEFVKKCGDRWSDASSNYNEFELQAAALSDRMSGFKSSLERLAEDESNAQTVIDLSLLMEKITISLEVNAPLLVDMQELKNIVALLIPCTTNSAINQFQGRLSSIQETYTIAQQVGSKTIAKCEQRLTLDSEFKEEIKQHTCWMDEVENELRRLSEQSPFLDHLPLPKSASLDDCLISEMTFIFLNFSAAICEYLEHQKQAFTKQSKVLAVLNESVVNRGKVIDKLQLSHLLKDEMVTVALNTLKLRVSRLNDKIGKTRQDNSTCKLLIEELDISLQSGLDELKACVETFCSIEADSRSPVSKDVAIALQRLSKVQNGLDAIRIDIPFIEIYQRVQNKWQPCSLLIKSVEDEVDGLRQRISVLRESVTGELQALERLASYFAQFTKRCDEFSKSLDRTNIITSEVAVDTVDAIATCLNETTMAMQTEKQRISNLRMDINKIGSDILAKQATTLKEYAHVRRRPVGVLALRIEQCNNDHQSILRRSEKLDRELSVQCADWDVFLAHFNDIRQWITIRQNRLLEYASMDKLGERMSGIRTLTSEMKDEGESKLEAGISLGHNIPMNNSQLVNAAISCLRSQWDELRKSISLYETQIRHSIVVDEDLRNAGLECERYLEGQENELRDILAEPIMLLLTPPGVQAIMARIERLQAASAQLVNLKVQRLLPFDKKVQLAKAQLRECNMNLSEVTSALTINSSMWNRFKQLEEKIVRMSSELENLSVVYSVFFELYTTTAQWIEKKGQLLDIFNQPSNATDVRDLTGHLSTTVNNVHQLSMDLHSIGVKKLKDCQESCIQLLNKVQSTKHFLIQYSLSRNPTQTTLLFDLQKKHLDLTERSAQLEIRLADTLLWWSAFDEIYVGLNAWIVSVESDASLEKEDSATDMKLLAVPGTYVTIRSTNLLSNIRRCHERVAEIADRQPQIELLLSRSNRFLQAESAEMSRCAGISAKLACELSHRFALLSGRVRRRLEECSTALVSVERLQDAREVYLAWEKTARSAFTRIQIGNQSVLSQEDCLAIKTATKNLIDSLQLGCVMLETCKRWAITVQSEVLASSLDTTHILADDLISSYKALQDQIVSKQAMIEQTLLKVSEMRHLQDSLTTWIDEAESKFQLILNELLDSTRIDLAEHETRTKETFALLSSLKLELIDRDSDLVKLQHCSGLAKRFEVLKVRLLSSAQEVEAHINEIIAFRQASELVMVKQSLSLEQYLHACGNSNDVETTLASLTSIPDVEKRLAILRDLQEQLNAEGHHLVELMLNSADRLLANAVQNAYVVDLVVQQTEQARREQGKLRSNTQKALETLKDVSERWKYLSSDHESLEAWLTEHEQTASRPFVVEETCATDKEKKLQELKVSLTLPF